MKNDTIITTDDIRELSELLAENVHNVCAKNRLKEGRALVPYGELTESEKDFDRRTAMETLKLILRLGYEIRRKPDGDITPP